MKRFFERLLGAHSNPRQKRPANVLGGLVIESFSHNLVRIPQLDFFGPHAASPNGQYHLIWLDRNPEGSIGGHRQEGHGSWALMGNNGERLADGRLERPQDGHVADDGTFILSDWLFGDGLKSRLIACGVDGQQLVQREFSANMASTGLSRDGGYAICQTANASGSPDSCRYFLFDVSLGQEIASWVQETGWAESYDFDTENQCVYLIGTDGERVGYTFDGTMVDRRGWRARRIAAGDLDVIRPTIDGGALAPQLREAILAGLSVAIASGEVWKQARALRLQGEMQEQTGDVDAAIDSYEKALTIDP